MRHTDRRGHKYIQLVSEAINPRNYARNVPASTQTKLNRLTKTTIRGPESNARATHAGSFYHL